MARIRGALIGVCALALGLNVVPVMAKAAPQPHASLVPQSPATGYPIILGTPQYTTTNENCPGGCTLNRAVFGVNQAGRFIAAGGNFYEVELQDGSVLQQKYFAAWNIDTKQIACAGQFTFNGNVRSIEPAASSGKVYVGGDFTKITGGDGVQRTRNKLALLDLTTCTVDTAFVVTGTNAKVTDTVLFGSRLFVGGDFTSINAQAVSYVAELDPVTGAVRPSFKYTFGSTSLATKIRGMGVNPDGSRLLFGGRFGTVSDGALNLTTQTVIADITSPTPRLVDHRFVQPHPEANNRPTGQSLQDVAISPDGTAFGLAYGTATVSDYAYVVNAVAGNQPLRWRHAMGDTSTGVAISNNAIYFTGHFCRMDTGPGTTDIMAPKMGLDTCTGSSTFRSGAWRTHISAMSLSDGTPLAWNPGQDSGFGGEVITVTTRGLLVGFDGQRSNSIRVGAVAFYDFGPAVEDSTPPTNVVLTQPTAGATVNNPLTIAGKATDNTSVASYRVRVKAADGRFLQADGTLIATAYEFKADVLADGSFQIDIPLSIAGGYTAQAKAIDTVGLRSAAWGGVAFIETGIEVIPPQTTIVTNPASPIPSENPVSVSGTATDNTAVATISARITNAAGLFMQSDKSFAATPADYPLTTSPLNAASVTWSADLGGLLPVGTYAVSVAMTDSSGNLATKVSTFSVAAVAPKVTIVNPAAKLNSGTLVPVSGSVTDNLAVASLVAQITDSAGQFMQDDGAFSLISNDLKMTVTGLNTASASFTYTGPLLPDGTYTVTLTARDRVGNVTAATRTFVIAPAPMPKPAIAAYTGFSRNFTFFGLTSGFRFTVAANSKVYALGVGDTNGNGVLDNTSATAVGIWRASDRVLIATASVPTNAASEGGWFYANLTTPVDLQTGVTYVIGQQVFAFREQEATSGTATPAAGVTYLGYASTSGSTLTYPSSQGKSTGGRGMPNLKIA